MPRPSRPWFRFYVEATRDRKLRRRKPAHRWLWVVLLAMARQSSRPGWLLIGAGPAQVSDIADEAALRPSEVQSGLDAFAEEGMILRDGDAWRVVNWDERQFESDTSTERTAKHRSKNGDRTLPVTPPETEADTDTETPQPPKRRERDEIWDAVVDVCEIHVDGITKSARGAYNAAVKAIRDAGGSPADVRARAGRYRVAFPTATLTPPALARHWPELANGQRPADPTDDAPGAHHCESCGELDFLPGTGRMECACSNARR